MEQFKRTQVIILPTENNTNIVKILKDNLHYTTSKNIPGGIYQNLYIISDDEIKEGDYRYSKIQNNVTLAVKTDINTNYYKETKNYYFKVIAATDNSLTLSHGGDFGNNIVKSLPKPSQQFIEKYIESYNKDKIITDVLVEMEIDEEIAGYEHSYLKINPKENTITIKKLKDNWNKEEIIELLKDFKLEIESAIDSDDDGNIFTNINVNDWINKKL